jgi:hypothetical protein
MDRPINIVFYLDAPRLPLARDEDNSRRRQASSSSSLVPPPLPPA